SCRPFWSQLSSHPLSIPFAALAETPAMPTRLGESLAPPCCFPWSAGILPALLESAFEPYLIHSFRRVGADAGAPDTARREPRPTMLFPLERRHPAGPSGVSFRAIPYPFLSPRWRRRRRSRHGSARASPHHAVSLGAPAS